MSKKIDKVVKSRCQNATAYKIFRMETATSYVIFTMTFHCVGVLSLVWWRVGGWAWELGRGRPGGLVGVLGRLGAWLGAWGLGSGTMGGRHDWKMLPGGSVGRCAWLVVLGGQGGGGAWLVGLRGLKVGPPFFIFILRVGIVSRGAQYPTFGKSTNIAFGVG